MKDVRGRGRVGLDVIDTKMEWNPGITEHWSQASNDFVECKIAMNQMSQILNQGALSQKCQMSTWCWKMAQLSGYPRVQKSFDPESACTIGGCNMAGKSDRTSG